MFTRCIWCAALLAFALMLQPSGPAMAADDDGIVRIKSAYSMPETIKRIKKDVADKGIMFFDEIDQSKLAADAGVTLRPSTLIVFGNPPLGTLFLTSNPSAGLDWPVRVLVYQDEKGDVWVNYTDFMWIAHRARCATPAIRRNRPTRCVTCLWCPTSRRRACASTAKAPSCIAPGIPRQGCKVLQLR